MWSTGTIWTDGGKAGYDYWVKHYEEGSEYGIEGEGRISKLTIRRHGECRDLVNYDRGWDLEVPDNEEVKAVYAILLEKYN
jgi:hypothetical protein